MNKNRSYLNVQTAFREVLLGFCRKQIPLAPLDLAATQVQRIASVSVCIAKRPEGYVERWDHNGAGLYDTPEAADVAAEGVDFTEYEAVAYSFVPVRFNAHGGMDKVSTADVFGQSFCDVRRVPALRDFRFLGYDPVQQWATAAGASQGNAFFGGGFDCSPLSCNGLSKNYPVNQ